MYTASDCLKINAAAAMNCRLLIQLQITWYIWNDRQLGDEKESTEASYLTLCLGVHDTAWHIILWYFVILPLLTLKICFYLITFHVP